MRRGELVGWCSYLSRPLFSNYLDLLTPPPRAGELSEKAPSCRSGPQPGRDHGEKGGVLAFLCESSSRKVGRRRRRAARTGGSRPHRPADASVPGKLLPPMQTSCHRPPGASTKYGGEYHQKKTDMGIQNNLCAVKPLIMLAGHFTCRRKD